ncbi:MAG TPA: prolyl oligopeptidase family serine peptidase [Clostridiales bacterium]|nr:prolyl oligopeptidase family serine peptidase [Clostridiales bacterium]
MRKKAATVLLSMLLAVTLALNPGTKAGAADAGAADPGKQQEAGKTGETVNLTSVTYTTVTEAFDWGPAITKVILDMGTPIDNVTLTIHTFQVSSERIYSSLDYMTGKMVDKDEIKERKVTRVYTCDQAGKRDSEGKYITLELQVGPDLSEGSPFATDATGANAYVDTSYIIKLSDTANLTTADGRAISMTPTDKAGNKGNVTLLADKFDQTGSYTKDGITLKYASYTPAKASKKQGSNPLIIWLHGAGEGGTDPSIALIGNKVVSLADKQIQSCFGTTGAYVLVPQAPTMWMDYDGKGTYNNTVPESGGRSYYTKTLKGLIDQFVKEHPEIDKNRIYIGGCSNGGYMTLNMLFSYPDYFAAAFPICEAYDDSFVTDEKINSIKDIPIWLTAAKNDPVVVIYEGSIDYSTFTYSLKLDAKGNPVPLNNFSNAAYNRLVAAGAKDVHYSLFDNVIDTPGKYFKAGTKEPYEYMGHFSWIYALNNECKDEINGKTVTLFEWLAGQSK